MLSQRGIMSNSPSKAQYSFPKSARFISPKPYCQSFYNIPSRSSKICTKIGSGLKIDWDFNKDKSHIVPSPTTYNQIDFTTSNLKSSRGYTPGHSREQTLNQSYISYDKCIPGVGHYTIQGCNNNKNTPKYSMSPQLSSELFVKKSSLIVPGPGRYQTVDTINPQGQYRTSTKSNSKSKRFNPAKSMRFIEEKNQVPGPGKYASNGKNSSFNAESRYTSTGNRMFSTANRSTIFDQNSKKYQNLPGPGAYDLLSDFGTIQNMDSSKIIRNSTRRPASSRINRH